jgi:poly(hydroxyalkanoate) depolymerase family esterase
MRSHHDPKNGRRGRPPFWPAARRRRRKYAWPALVALTLIAAFGLAPAAGAASSWSWPTIPVPLPRLAQPWWSYLPGLGGTTTPTTPTGGTTGGTGSSTPSTPSKLSGTPFAGTYTNSAGSLVYQGYVPSTYKSGTAVPLVVALHGCTETADQFRQLTRWDELAEAKGFIVVFPQQSKDNNSMNCWNFFQTAHMSRGAGEPSLIAGLTTWVQQHYTVDAHRTYVTGLSAGGAMSSVMAATYPDLYAAAGIGSGCEYAATAACAGYKSADPVTAGQQAYKAMGQYARPMPVILFEGDKDTTVPPVNAQQIVQQWQVTDDLADDGAGNGSIPVQATSVTQGSVPGGHTYSVTQYSDGSHKELLESWLVNGMGHAWSGGCSCQQYADPAGPDETGAMYAFFMAHPKP